MKTCPDCNGDGVAEKGTDDEQQCPTCGGRGFVPDDDDGQEEVIKTRHANQVPAGDQPQNREGVGTHNSGSGAHPRRRDNRMSGAMSASGP